VAARPKMSLQVKIILYVVLSALSSLMWWLMKPEPDPEQAKKQDEHMEALNEVVKMQQQMSVQWNSDQSTEDTLAGIDEVQGVGAKPDDASVTPQADLPSVPSDQAALPREIPDPLSEVLDASGAAQSSDPVAALPVSQPDPVSFNSESEESPQVVRHQPLEMIQSLTSPDYHYRVVAPAGWALVDGLADLALVLGDDLTVLINGGAGGITNMDFARKEISRVRNSPDKVSLKNQQMVKLDGKSWGRFDFSSDTGLADDQILFTYAGKRGRYSILVQGSDNALRNHAQAIGKLIGSFRFPPDNVMLKNLPSVKVTVP